MKFKKFNFTKYLDIEGSPCTTLTGKKFLTFLNLQSSFISLIKFIGTVKEKLKGGRNRLKPRHVRS